MNASPFARAAASMPSPTSARPSRTIAASSVSAWAGRANQCERSGVDAGLASADDGTADGCRRRAAASRCAAPFAQDRRLLRMRLRVACARAASPACAAPIRARRRRRRRAPRGSAARCNRRSPRRASGRPLPSRRRVRARRCPRGCRRRGSRARSAIRAADHSSSGSWLPAMIGGRDAGRCDRRRALARRATRRPGRAERAACRWRARAEWRAGARGRRCAVP